MGKTQTALAIREKFISQRLVLYFLGTLSDISQPVYEPFVEITLSFAKCVERDFEDTSLENEYDCRLLSLKELYTYGFIKAAIESWMQKEKNAEETFEFSKCSHDQVAKLLDKLEVPIIIIDEFAVRLKSVGQHDRDVRNREKKVRFMRNVFRSLNLILIIAGTNSRASNLIESVKLSGRSYTSSPWCYMDACSFEKEITLPLLRDIFINSRPFFSQVACEYLLSYDFHEETDLASIIDAISYKVAFCASRRKEMFKNEWGALGQFCIFKNASYIGESFLPPDLVNNHYATLVSPSNESQNCFG
jgi:hypothetical protein